MLGCDRSAAAYIVGQFCGFSQHCGHKLLALVCFFGFPFLSENVQVQSWSLWPFLSLPHGAVKPSETKGAADIFPNLGIKQDVTVVLTKFLSPFITWPCENGEFHGGFFLYFYVIQSNEFWRSSKTFSFLWRSNKILIADYSLLVILLPL